MTSLESQNSEIVIKKIKKKEKGGSYPLSPRTITLSKVLLRIDMVKGKLIN